MRPLQISEEKGVLVIKLDDAAALNEGQAAGIRQVLYGALEKHEAPQVALDLSAIDYISSTGIALMIGTKRRVEARHGHLVLFGLQAEILALFKVMKLVSLFEIAADRASALGLFRPEPSA